MKKKNISGNGNKVAQPTQTKVLLEHITRVSDRIHFRYHYFESLDEAKSFRTYLIKEGICDEGFNQDFTIEYSNEKDECTILNFDSMISEDIKIHIVDIEPNKKYETELTFEERLKRDIDWDPDPNNDVFAKTFIPIEEGLQILANGHNGVAMPYASSQIINNNVLPF